MLQKRLREIRENNDERCGKDDKCGKIVIVIMVGFSVSSGTMRAKYEGGGGVIGKVET